MIEISEGFFYFFQRIQYLSGDTVVILDPCTDILEKLELSLLNLSFITIIYFGCCSLVYLSSEMGDEIDLFYFIVLLCTLFHLLKKNLIYHMNLIYSMSCPCLIHCFYDLYFWFEIIVVCLF